MEFATSLLSSASTALAAAQKSTLSSTYSPFDPNPASPRSPLRIGVWTVSNAKHNSNGKLVSIWTCDKGHLVRSSNDYLPTRNTRSSAAPSDSDRIRLAVDTLKREASSLSRLRHPCVLEMAEPPTETRSSISFATEPVLSSLQHALDVSTSSSSSGANGSTRRQGRRGQRDDDDLELDEVEIQKGMSQIGKGLQFLHESAKLVHGNLTPEAVIINAKGDWKLSGFGLSTYLTDPDGAPAKWQFPTYDPALPRSIQRDYDYIAPEYILDEAPPSPSNDLFSLGCVLHYIHVRTGPPFSNHQTLSTARSNLEASLALLEPQWRKLPPETQEVLASLITRYPNRRMTAAQFLQSRYFGGLLVGTLRFLERDSFNAQSGEAQASFLKGLVSVLPSFSTKVNRLKILPTLLELTLQTPLIPFLLPPILYISATLSNAEFQDRVLPSLKPLFTVKEPPQAVIGLLENVVGVFREKCSPAVFREEVMPLVYHALESDNPVVLEKALKVVPPLCETLDYTTVKGTLFPKITTVFSKTTLLSVKVNTLICFHSMIKLLDKYTLTEKLVPLLAKIKTKEPSVMIATLAVHEEMGKKCEVEAIATLILPQLWAMSIGPLLNVDQFTKFITVIKALSARVETEHHHRLAELKRLEESSSSAAAGPHGLSRGAGGALGHVNPGLNGVSDFEALVRGATEQKSDGLGARGRQVDIFSDESPASTPMPTGGAFSSPPLPALPTSSPPFASPSTFSTAPTTSAVRPTPTPRMSSTPSTSSTAVPRSNLGARSVPPASFNSNAFSTPLAQPSQPNGVGSLKSFAPLQPQPRPSSAQSTFSSSPAAASGPSTPNYSFSSLSLAETHTSGGLPPLQPTTSSVFNQPPSFSQPQQQQPAQTPPPIKWNVVPPIQTTPSSLSSHQPLSSTPASFASTPSAPPAPRPNLPPGYSSSSSTLQPTVRNSSNANGKGPGGQGAMGAWGDWGDLDPLK
ncbi:hypothetical protein JCM10212_001884 [Sporobolomyces blumeae]